MKEYKLAKGWIIFIYIGALALIGSSVILLTDLFITNKTGAELKAGWFLGSLAVGMIIFMLIALIETHKNKLVIDEGRIQSISIFGNRSLLLEEIKGYRLVKNYIFIEPVDKSKKRIKISTYLGKSGDIENWLSSRFPDLDILRAEHELQDILTSEDFGRTTEDREYRLKKAKHTCRILNILGGIVAVWVLFRPEPYDYSIVVCLAVPLIAIAVLKLSGGLISFIERKDSAFPSVFTAAFYPAMAIIARALLDFEIEKMDNGWLLILGISVTLLKIVTTGNTNPEFKKKNKLPSIIGLFLILLAYTYGAVIILNCLYDSSAPKHNTATVVSKRISGGKSTTYYLELTPWKNEKGHKEVSVSKSLYQQTEENDTVNVYFKKGALNMPWYFLTE